VRAAVNQENLEVDLRNGETEEMDLESDGNNAQSCVTQATYIWRYWYTDIHTIQMSQATQVSLQRKSVSMFTATLTQLYTLLHWLYTQTL
jgi:hypothetical protein